jgi:hypothetical protein
MRTADDLVEWPLPLTGPVKINRGAIIANFDGCKIVQTGGNFRLRSNDGLSVELEPMDALWIIQTLALGVAASTIMRRVCIWEGATTESNGVE